ncbi:MAG: rhodanese-like domain-containing protein [Arsenophonus endosymbiont of Ceratovacuna japonica]
MIQEIIQFINKYTIISLIWIILLISVITLTIKELFNKIKNITSSQAIQLINKEKAIIIDLRSNENFYKGHIVNSINLTLSEIKYNNIDKIKKYKHKPIIIVSTNGIEAYKPAKQLIQYGFKYIFILKKGINGWSNENLPLANIKK